MLFTFNSYRRLLDLIAECGYGIYGIEQILTARRDGNLPDGNYVAIRHDVDYFPNRAIAMAKIEAEKKFAVTYYIRRRFFDADLESVRQIAGMGHQIGYHYEEVDTSQNAPGNQIGHDAVEFFIGSLLDIDQLGFPIRSVCAHGNPLTDVDNRQVVHLLRDQAYIEKLSLRHDRAEIAEKISDRLVGDASIDITGNDFDLYIPDTGRFNPKYNLKDRIDNCPIAGLSNLDDLQRILTGGNYPRVYMNMHPDRWSGDIATWLFDFAFDTAKNTLKRFMGKTGYRGKLVGAKAQKQDHAASHDQGDKPDVGPDSRS